ncbi:hypothetical protein MHZ92_15805 [Sporosarcina sp. ACRSL]|uniref:hypothetical protein n=1 Tax=Sporosarcina sp. ACRSL TaxID=2918215 RepID=UPI001EF71F13|nr:hypothetical protein [Sporosarcina sp. ACRSL]MCG7345598.1 hypothetical protein [Sporosarcina sp. ACRSL]
MLKYKKMFALSVVLAVASAFILPGTEYGFGWPLAWLEYTGESSITLASELFQPTHFGDLFFDLWNLLFGALLIYVVLLVMYKGLNRLNKESEVGENER